MKFTERFLIILVIIGIGMRFIDSTAGIFMQSLATTALALFYMFFCFFLVNDVNYNRMFKRESYTDMDMMDVFKGVAAGGIFAMALFSILFVTMGFEGSHKIYNIALAICFVHFIVVRTVYNRYKSQDDKQLMIRSSVLVGLLLVIKLVELTLFKKMG